MANVRQAVHTRTLNPHPHAYSVPPPDPPRFHREQSCLTNGVLLDDTWAEFLAENRFLVGLSIDGPAELHDCYRMNKGGQPTFKSVLRGLGFLRKHGVEFNTLTVVHRKNSHHALEVYRFLKEVGRGFMQFIPIVERVAEAPDPHVLVLIGPRSGREAAVSEWSVEPLQFGKFLCSIFDEWVRCDEEDQLWGNAGHRL